ncbi:hypothetical protein I7I51_01978 [Histoplasma capsulatum]|uniref:Ferric reductase NAD binding domain-containing protein n=1 Tax=Ajellomyces capsulatus TaxID=5037 RepID=A0A8A1MJQ8_AJECA|nr:hypothetical protein I7I51_01978 [Histoplasma capsulatum]
MDLLTVYALSAAGFVVLFRLHRLLLRGASYIFSPQMMRLCLQNHPWPYLIPRRRLFGPVTFSRAFIHLLHVSGTVACNITGVRDNQDASARAGSLAVLHLSPLLLASQSSQVADWLGVTLTEFHIAHRALALMAVIQSAIHVGLLLPQTELFDFRDRFLRYGSVASRWGSYTPPPVLTTFCSFLVISIRQITFLRGYSSYGAGLAASKATAYSTCHLLYSRRIYVWLYIRAKCGKGVVSQSLGATPALSHRRSGAADGCSRVDILSLAAVEAPPRSTYLPRFELAWWETSPDGRAASVSVLIEVDSGFTRKLWLTRHRRLRIIVDGPYGGKDLDRWQPLSTGFPYDAVALVATGIGIVGQLPFIRELLQRFVSEEKAMHTRGGGVRRHRISLVWQLDKEEHMNWICDWMDQLLADDDTTLILHISLYILDCSDQSVRNERPGRRIDVHYKEELDVKKILDRELEEWSDKMLVTACASPAVLDELRNIALHSKGRIDFHQLDFQPNSARGGFWAPNARARQGVA